MPCVAKARSSRVAKAHKKKRPSLNNFADNFVEVLKGALAPHIKKFRGDNFVYVSVLEMG